MIDNFTQAIIYFSQNFLSLVPPSAIIRHVFLGEKNAIISQSIDFSVQLSRFVECSINAVSVPQERRSRYEFWSQILDNLLSQGDFNYAFSIAAALNSNAMESIMPKKIHEDIAIACPLANFKNYRFMLSASSNNFHIPSLMITIHDLSMLKDTEFFLGDKLNLSFIASLSDMRESMSAAYKKMQERDYRPSEAMIKFFGDMPQSKEECWYFSPGAFKERMQKNGRRNLSFKSISGFPAAAATVFDSPRKLKEHEQAKYAYKKAEIF
jgi:hypothetical protein